MRNKKYLLPILGITTLATITAPVIASCSCSISDHVWYTPMMDRRQYADKEGKGLFICVLDKDNYQENDLEVKIVSDYANILAIDSIKVNLTTVEVVVKCVDKTIGGELPFCLSFKTSQWQQSVTDLVLVVTPRIDHIEIEGDSTINFGETKTYTAKAYDKEGAEVEVDFVWSISPGSDNAKIESTAGNTASIKGIGVGDATIKVGIKNAASFAPATKNITVEALPATDVEIKGNDKILLNTSENYTAIVSPNPGAIQKVVWSLNQKTAEYPGEVEVVPGTEKDNTISLKGLSQGAIQLIATVPNTDPEIKYSKVINVKNPGVKEIVVAGTTEFYSGDTNKFIATISPSTATKVVSWSVHDTETATEPSKKATIAADEDGNGVITVKSGQQNGFELYVRATSTDGTNITGQTKTKVKIPLTGFAIDGAQIARLNSGTYQYIVKPGSITPSGATYDPDSIEWVLPSTETKASIEKKTGVLTPLAYGGETPVTITAKLKSKTTVSATLDVKILDAIVTDLTINGPEEVWTDENDDSKLQYGITYSPTESHEGVTWTSTNANIKIDENGKLINTAENPLVAGKTTIYATAKDTGKKKSNEIELTVKQAASKITVDATCEKTPQVGAVDFYQYTSTVEPAGVEGTTVYSAEPADTNAGEAEMTSDGKLSPTKKGDMNVYAIFKQEGREDLKSAPFPINILAPTAKGVEIVGSDVISFNSSGTTETATYEMKLLPEDAEIDETKIKWSVAAGTGDATVSPATGNRNVTLTPSKSGTITLKVEVEDTELSDELPIKITSSWHSIFTTDETDPSNIIVTGFQPDYATYINGYVDGTETLVFPQDATVTSIKEDSFKNLIITGTGCQTAGVTKVLIPANIATIGDNAFDNDADSTKSIIQTVEIQGATTIGDEAFINNDALTKLIAVNGVTVGSKAFKGNKALATITLGSNSKTVIGDEAFAELQAASVTLTANPKTIGQEAFSKSKGLLWTGINNVTAIEEIGIGAFTACKLLPDDTTLKINNKLANATIGDAAFFASGINSIWLPEQTANTMYANWGRTLFANCKSLNSIDVSDWSSIPANLSEKDDLFLLSGSSNTNTWYYKSGLSEAIVTSLSDWMDIQFGDSASEWSKEEK